MKITKSKILVLAFVMGLVAPSAMAQNMLQSYLDAVSSILPNTMNLSVYEEIRYNDNIHNSPSDEEDALIFKTGASATIYRTKGNITYGLDGDISYDWYTRDSDDLSTYRWNLSPFLEGKLGQQLLQGLMISIKSRSVYEPYSKTNTRYVRHYENGIGLVYDYSRHDRWGVISTAEYTNYYYPQGTRNRYNTSTNNKYNFSIAPYYKVTEKIRSGLQLAYEIIDYRDYFKYDDSSNVRITGFVDYRVNVFLSMTAHAGFERNAFEGRSRDTKYDRYFRPVFSYVLRYVPSMDWMLSYTTRFEPEYGSETGRGLREAWNNNLSVTWNATSKISVVQTLGFDVNDEKNCNEDTSEISYSLRVNYHATDNIVVYGGYEYDDIHFKYVGDNDYRRNEFILGLRWTLL